MRRDRLSEALEDRESFIDSAVNAWLKASNRNPGARTAGIYASVMDAFRRWLRRRGMDLVSAELRWLSDSTPPAHVQMGFRQKWEFAVHQAQELATALEEYAASRVDVRHSGVPTSLGTQAQRIAIISSFYRFAFKNGYLEGQDPIIKVKRPTSYRRQDFSTIPEPLPFMRRLALIDRTSDSGVRDFALLLTALTTARYSRELWAMQLGHLQTDDDHLALYWPRCRGGESAFDRLPLTGPDALAAQALLAWVGRLVALRRSAGAEEAWQTCPEMESSLWVSLANNGTRGHLLSEVAIRRICQKRLGISKVQVLRYVAARSWEDHVPISDIQIRLAQRTLTPAYVLDSDPHVRRDNLVAWWSALGRLISNPPLDAT